MSIYAKEAHRSIQNLSAAPTQSRLSLHEDRTSGRSDAQCSFRWSDPGDCLAAIGEKCARTGLTVSPNEIRRMEVNIP